MDQLLLQLGFDHEGPQKLIDESIRFAESIRARRTLQSYLSDWKTFCLWCAKEGREALPATTDTAKLYISRILFFTTSASAQ